MVWYRALERGRELRPAKLEGLRASPTFDIALRRFILSQFVLEDMGCEGKVYFEAREFDMRSRLSSLQL